MGFLDWLLGKKTVPKQDAGLTVKDPRITAIGNTEPVCPYCNYKFDKMPLKKKQCPNCKNFIRSRTRPLDNKKILIREGQIDELEMQWAFKNGYSVSQINALKKEGRKSAQEYANQIKGNSKEYTGISRANIKKIREIIADYYLEGKKFGETSREIVRLVENLDIERASLIVRTETAEANYRQILNKYRKDRIEEVDVLVALDDQPCDICRALDGKRFSINKPPKIPVHEGCRCTIVAHIDVPKID